MVFVLKTVPVAVLVVSEVYVQISEVHSFLVLDLGVVLLLVFFVVTGSKKSQQSYEMN